MGRPLGSKDKRKRKYNPKSGQNGNGNIYKTPCVAICMVTIDPKVKHDPRQELSAQALPEVAEKLRRKLEALQFTVLTDQFWEISAKRKAVHCHFICGRICVNRTQLNEMFYHHRPDKERESMKRAICRYATFYNNQKKGTFGTWKVRLYQDPDAIFTNPKTNQPWSDSMPYLDAPTEYKKPDTFHRVVWEGGACADTVSNSENGNT